MSKENIVMGILNVYFSIYIAIFRGTPMIVQSMVIYYGLSWVLLINIAHIA